MIQNIHCFCKIRTKFIRPFTDLFKRFTDLIISAFLFVQKFIKTAILAFSEVFASLFPVNSKYAF